MNDQHGVVLLEQDMQEIINIVNEIQDKITIGSFVKVLYCTHGHEFEIGEIVSVVSKSYYNDDWLCRNEKGIEWYLCEEEFKMISYQ